MTSSLFLVAAALSTYCLIVARTSDWLTPAAVLCLSWFSSAAVADIPFFKDPLLQVSSWEIETYAAIYLSGGTVFLVGFALAGRHKQGFRAQEPSKLYKMAINILLLASLLAVVPRLSVQGLLSIVYNYGAVDMKEAALESIPVIHYIEILTPFLALAALYELGASKAISGRRRAALLAYILYAVFIFSLVVSASRGTLLVIVCGSLFFFSRFGRLKAHHLLMLLGLSILFMAFLSLIRLPAGTIVNDYFGDRTFSKLSSSIYTYIVFCFENLNSLIKSDVDLSYIYYSLKFVFWPIAKANYLANDFGLESHSVLFFNARTYLYGFYHDLGLAGAMLYPGIIAFCITRLYCASSKHPSLLIVLMALQKPIWFVFFGNYFFGELVLFVPLVIMLLLAILYQFRTGRGARREDSPVPTMFAAESPRIADVSGGFFGGTHGSKGGCE